MKPLILLAVLVLIVAALIPLSFAPLLPSDASYELPARGEHATIYCRPNEYINLQVSGSGAVMDAWCITYRTPVAETPQIIHGGE